MATAVKRRVSNVEGRQNGQRKILKTMERSYRRESLSSHQTDHIAASILSSEYGPSKLNLYLYVAEESHYLWEKAKDMFILKPDSEPKKGILLFHDRETDPVELCRKHFEFDPRSTSSSSVKLNSNTHTDMVWVFGFGKSFWKTTTTATLETLKEKVGKFDKSHIFFITHSDEDKQDAVRFCKEIQICSRTHVIQTASDKNLLYETMYEILQKQLESFVSDLKSRASTRLVQSYTSELDILLGKLQSRKKKHHTSLPKQCIAKIESGNEFGIVGHRLCGNALYIFEDERITTDAKEIVQIKKSIEETFKGDVYYRSIKDVLSPQADPWSFCGGPITNNNNGKTGTLGILGELEETKQIVALSSGHVFSADHSAILPQLGNIGVCIWPENPDPLQNIHDVSVIRLDLDQQRIDQLLKGLILQETITVEKIPNKDLGYQRVFKYGAKTGRTTGHIGVVSDFKLYGKDVMTILPIRSECPTGLFSNKGDSGAILLTRYQEKLHGIGVIYGGGMDLPGFINIREESIAVFLKNALRRFETGKGQTIVFDKI